METCVTYLHRKIQTKKRDSKVQRKVVKQVTGRDTCPYFVCTLQHISISR